MTNNKSGDVFSSQSNRHPKLKVIRAADLLQDKPLLKHMHGIYKHVTAFFKCFELIPARTRG